MQRIERKVTAATLGAAVGQILDAGLAEGASLEWWPVGPAAVILAFVFGYFVPNR